MIVMRYILGFLFLGGCWHAGAVALGPDLLPDPVATIRLFAESLGTPEFWGHILVSLWRLTLGLVAAVAVAFPLGLLLGHCRAADLAGSPLLFITYPLPKGSSSKTPVTKPDGTKMFRSVFLNDARRCCFFTNIIVKYYYDNIRNLVVLWKSCSMAN